MAAKKKVKKAKKAKKTARKNPCNPRKHVPKTTRGRKATSRAYKIEKYDKSGNFVGSVSGRGSIATAENKARSSVKGGVSKVILNY